MRISDLRLCAFTALLFAVCTGGLCSPDGPAPPDGRRGWNRDAKAEFDKDGDGKLSEEEKRDYLDHVRKENLRKYDKDGDGKLSPEERKQIERDNLEERRRHMEEQHMLRRFDKDGDGRLSSEEKAEAEKERQRIEKLMDSNGDGQITPEERRAFLKERKKQFLEKFDLNRDGEVTEEEKRKVISEYMKKGPDNPPVPHGEHEKPGDQSEELDDSLIPSPPE